jgi:hypothetical protein
MRIGDGEVDCAVPGVNFVRLTSSAQSTSPWVRAARVFGVYPRYGIAKQHKWAHLPLDFLPENGSTLSL